MINYGACRLVMFSAQYVVLPSLSVMLIATVTLGPVTPRLEDRSHAKQFQRALSQLQAEDVVGAALRLPRTVLAAVGPLQFEIEPHRLAAESGSPVRLDRLPYKVVRRLVDSAR